MKKICAMFISILFFITQIANAVENQICGIGAVLLKDPFNKKTFITGVLPNSPAQQSYLPIGAEIISVNEVKTKPLSLDQIASLIKGEESSKVNLLIKYNGSKTNYEIIRSRVSIPQKKEDKVFNAHWQQVVPAGLEDVTYIPNEISSKVSRNYYTQVVVPTNYWAERKIGFKKGYDACMTYPKMDQSACLINLVNREIAKTDSDRQAEIQEQIAKQQATQNFINTMNQIQTNTNLNNINNSLQQQNFNLMNTNMQLYNINNTLRGW